jgi:hypothetical protein
LRDSALMRAKGIVWTDHGSTRWINTQVGLDAAIDYVERLQDEPARFEREAKERKTREKMLRMEREGDWGGEPRA